MSIAEELNRIRQAKSDLKQAINSKGGTLTVEKLESYAAVVRNLRTGSNDGSAVPVYYKCVQVKEGVTYNAIQVLRVDGGVFPITRNESMDYTYEAPSLNPDTQEPSIAIATAFNYTDEYGNVIDCVMSTPKLYGYIYPYNEPDPFDSGNGRIGIYIEVTIPPEWSGNKAVLTDGVYTFEEAVTEGLTYGNAFTPEVGKIYNGDATVRVEKLFEGASAIPDNGLIFYMPFNGTDEPVEGSVSSSDGTLAFGEEGGIGYAEFNGSQVLWCKTATPPGDSYTWSANFKTDTDSGMFVLDFREGNSAYSWYIRTVSGGFAMDGSNWYAFTTGQWVNFIVSWDNGYLKCYMNGVVVREYDYVAHQSFADLPDTFLIGDKYIRGEQFSGSVFDVAIWNRVLTAEEIAQVAGRAASIN